MSVYGVFAGNLSMLAAPIDSDGRLCGIQDTEAFPNLYYYDKEGNKTSTKYATCVKRCPDSDKFKFVTTDCLKTELIQDCTIGYGQGYSTEPLFNYCIRKDETEMEKK